MKKALLLSLFLSSFSVGASTDSGDFTDLKNACYNLGEASAAEDREATLLIVDFIDQLPIHSSKVCRESFKEGAINRASQFLSDTLEESFNKE